MDKQQNLKNVFDIDTTQEIKDYPPAVVLEKNENASVKLEFLEDFPRRIELKESEQDREDREKTNAKLKAAGKPLVAPPSAPIILVKNLTTGTEESLWLSAKSIQRPILGLIQRKGKLKGIKIVLSRRVFNVKKYGDVLGYAVREIKE